MTTLTVQSPIQKAQALLEQLNNFAVNLRDNNHDCNYPECLELENLNQRVDEVAREIITNPEDRNEFNTTIEACRLKLKSIQTQHEVEDISHTQATTHSSSTSSASSGSRSIPRNEPERMQNLFSFQIYGTIRRLPTIVIHDGSGRIRIFEPVITLTSSSSIHPFDGEIMHEPPSLLESLLTGATRTSSSSNSSSSSSSSSTSTDSSPESNSSNSSSRRDFPPSDDDDNCPIM